MIVHLLMALGVGAAVLPLMEVVVAVVVRLPMALVVGASLLKRRNP